MKKLTGIALLASVFTIGCMHEDEALKYAREHYGLKNTIRVDLTDSPCGLAPCYNFLGPSIEYKIFGIDALQQGIYVLVCCSRTLGICEDNQ